MRASTAQVSAADDPAANGGIMGQPVGWWLAWLAIFVVFLWAARKYGGGGPDGGRYGNILPSLHNGVFLTLFIVLILNVLKVGARKFPIPGLSELILAA
jgi:hypothetical protein